MPNIITPSQLSEWLKGKNWNIIGEEGDKTIARYRDVVELEIEPEEILYDMNVHAIEDPSDAIEEITHDPMKSLVEFVGAGIGDDFLSKMSTLKPSDMSLMLRRISFQVISGTVGPIKTSRILRRLAATVSLLGSQSITPARTAGASEFEKTTIRELEEKMKEKGWNVKETEPGNLEVNFGDQFEGTIIVDTMMWAYTIKVLGQKDLEESNQRTDDPIRDISKFMTQKSVDKILVEARERKENPEEKQNAPTVAPRR
jgi:hypothetical protein